MTPRGGTLHRRGLLAAFTAAALLVWTLAPRAEAAPKKKEKPFFVHGELIDLDCYLADAKKKGPDHEACARECITAGNPVAVLTSIGRLYLLLGRDMKPVNDIVLPFVGKYVKITGKKVTKGELNAILMDQIEEAQPPKSRSKASKPKH